MSDRLIALAGNWLKITNSVWLEMDFSSTLLKMVIESCKLGNSRTSKCPFVCAVKALFFYYWSLFPHVFNKLKKQAKYIFPAFGQNTHSTVSSIPKVLDRKTKRELFISQEKSISIINFSSESRTLNQFKKVVGLSAISVILLNVHVTESKKHQAWKMVILCKRKICHH